MFPPYLQPDWQTLGLDAPTRDAAAIKRAYALKLRVTRPDGDAQAYQALREAYDRVLHWARHQASVELANEEVPTAQNVAPPAHEETAGPTAPEPPPAEAPVPPATSPAQWCERIQRLRQEQGRAALAILPTLVPELLQDLYALPLQVQAEASVRFADLVISLNPLPAAFLKPLQAHFGWLDDFRTARLMGPDRNEALSRALSEVQRPITAPHVLHAYADSLAVSRLLGRRPAWRGKLAAALMGHHLPRQFASISSALQPRLGVGPLERRQMEAALSLGHALRTAATIATLLALNLLLGLSVSDAMMGATVASLGALVGLGVFIKGFSLLQSLHNKLSWPGWWGLPLLGLAAACAGILPRVMGDMPELVFITAVLGIGGVLLSLPRSFDQVFAASALLLYLAAVLQPMHHADMALAALWVLGSQQLYAERRLAPLILALRTPGRQQAPLRAAGALVAWVVIIVPAFIYWVAETLSFRLVLTTLFLTLGLSVAQIGRPPLPVPVLLLALPIALAALLGLQALAVRLGRQLAHAVRGG